MIDSEVIEAVRLIPDGGRTLEEHLIVALADELRSLEEQLQAVQKHRDQLADMAREQEDENRRLLEQYQTAEQALRAYHAIFTAWEGHKSITLNEEALRQWKSIAETALSNPASEPSEVEKGMLGYIEDKQMRASP